MEIGEYIDKYIITEVMHGGMSAVSTSLEQAVTEY